MAHTLKILAEKYNQVSEQSTEIEKEAFYSTPNTPYYRALYGQDDDSGSYSSGSRRSRRPYADRNDESNVWYRYDTETGKLMQSSIPNTEESSARAEGYRDSPESALRVYGIMRSKFNPNKYVKHENGRWVEVFPYGKPEDKPTPAV